MTADGRAVVLLYHRVAEPASDPWELAVTPSQFDEHLELLTRAGRVESLAQLAQEIDAGALTGLTFAITFDDGYADNLHAARPLLEAHETPATVFVTTGCLGGRPFWWDELAAMMLEGDGLPDRIELELDGQSHAWSCAELGARAAYEAVWAELQPLPDEARRRALAAVREQVGAVVSDDGRSLTTGELAELARDGLVEVGAHTETHPLLASLADPDAEREIVGSKARLEDLLDRPVQSFSYPFGGPAHYGAREVEIVRRAGFELACSAVPGVARAGADRFELARVPVGNWDGDALTRALEKLVGRVEDGVR